MSVIPVKGAPRPGVYYHLVRYARDGSEQPEGGDKLRSDALAAELAAPDCPYTDVFISSHGYNTDAVDADGSYQKWLAAMADDTADRAAADAARQAETGRPFAALLIGIHWPSKLWTAKLLSAFAGDSDSDSNDNGGKAEPVVAIRSLGLTAAEARAASGAGGAPGDAAGERGDSGKAEPAVAIRSLGLTAAEARAASGTGGPPGDAAVARELDDLVRSMNGEDAAALADRPAFKGALTTLADAAVHPPIEVATAAAAVDAGPAAGAAAVQPALPAALRAAYKELAAELAAVDAATAVGNDDDDDNDDEPGEQMSPDDAFAAAVEELTAEAAVAAAKKAPAAAAVASATAAATDTGATAPVVASRGVGTFLVGAASTVAAAALLRRTAIIYLFGRFQRRARVVGRVGVRGLLAKLMAAAAGRPAAAAGTAAAAPAPKFHLAGHSLGSHVVSSALVGPRRGATPLPAKVHSVALVQGAVPAGAYGPGKAYGTLLGPGGPVAGTVVVTYSRLDGALWFYGRAYGGEPLGRVGADHDRPAAPRRLVMGPADAAYDFGGGGGQMVNVDASAVVDAVEAGLGGKLVGAHSDVVDPPTTHLIWAAALAAVAPPAEGATR